MNKSGIWHVLVISRRVLIVKCRFVATILATAILALQAQEPGSPASSAKNDDGIMLAAVSRDRSMLSGGIGSTNWTERGTVVVEPIARLTSSGVWLRLSCSSENQKNCRKFQRDYLSKVHQYTVISSHGNGAVVRARPTTLSECFDYAGTGTYSGAPLEKSAVAASSSEHFRVSSPVRSLNKADSMAVRALLSKFVPKKLDSTRGLRILSVQLEGKNLYVVQRSFSEVPERERRRLVFGIGRIVSHRFEFLYWKQNVEDEDERIVGTVSLKSGREFLITVVNHPEGHFFRVYGTEGDRLKVVYSGGGSSC